MQLFAYLLPLRLLTDDLAIRHLAPPFAVRASGTRLECRHSWVCSSQVMSQASCALWIRVNARATRSPDWVLICWLFSLARHPSSAQYAAGDKPDATERICTTRLWLSVTLRSWCSMRRSGL